MFTVNSNELIDFNTSNEASNGKLWISSRKYVLQKSYISTDDDHKSAKCNTIKEM